ncbi:MAG: membrane integrity-associated transporter subunit PqiC [Phyllobacteriaceae bacterium]|nr:membrane integrity-associated transporter subunit PqiC [Phyllobacteriaceae bacterium]
MMAALASCAALPGGAPKPLDTYELTAPDITSVRRRPRVQVLVAEPSALKSLDGQNIVVKTSGTSLAYLDGAQWGDRLPKIVQARLAETFQRSGAFGGVGKPGEGLAIDYQIVTDVRAFEIVASGGEKARAALFVRLLNDRNGVIVAERLFEADAAVSGSGNDAYVDALNRAFGEAAGEIACPGRIPPLTD